MTFLMLELDLQKFLVGCEIISNIFYIKTYRFDKTSAMFKRGTINSNPLLWNSFGGVTLERLIPCLEFTIEIQSNNLMYNPNKAIRDRVFPVKIGKFSVKYYTF